MCMLENNFDDESILVPVMAWYCFAITHYPSHCWPRYMSTHGVTIGHNELINSIYITQLVFPGYIYSFYTHQERLKTVEYTHTKVLHTVLVTTDIFVITESSPTQPIPWLLPGHNIPPSVVCWLITETAKCNYLTIHWLPWNNNEADRIMFTGYQLIKQI